MIQLRTGSYRESAAEAHHSYLMKELPLGGKRACTSCAIVAHCLYRRFGLVATEWRHFAPAIQRTPLAFLSNNGRADTDPGNHGLG